MKAPFLCTRCSCPRASFPWLSIKGLDIGEGVHTFAFARLATKGECMQYFSCVFEFILQAVDD